MNKKKLNKKGDLKTDIPPEYIIILLILVVVIGIVIGVRHNTNKNTDAIQSCGSIGSIVGAGVCKESCATGELSMEGFGCEGTAKYCCTSSGNMVDVSLPVPYGKGTAALNFNVLTIEVDGGEATLQNSNCVKNSPDLSSIKCLSDSDISIPIKIGVINRGSSATEILAAPVIVISGNAENMIIDQYRPKVPTTLAVHNDMQYIQTTITISPDEAVLGSYWEVYPYALCTTQPCKNADTSSRGIYRTDNTHSNILTIKFVDIIN